MSQTPILKNGLNGAWVGFCLGLLALAFVAIARALMPDVRGRPDALPMLTLVLLYLIGAPALGFLGGVARTWLPGRLGSTLIATGIGAAATAIVLPFLPNTKFPWGSAEYIAIALLGLMCGVFIGARHRG
jgi:hypothetical protein